MESAAKSAASLVEAVQIVWSRKWHFLSLFILVLATSVSALTYLDLLPERLHSVVAEPSGHTDVNEPESIESPTRIEALSVGLDAIVSNPTSTEIKVLDAALLNGAVRYPTSAKLGENGNVVLFGHSSYLPVVKNKAYKTFDGIQDLKPGASIVVYSKSRAYTYSVKSLVKASTDSGVIPLEVTGRVLTLATCDSFGAKTARYILTAEFVESHLISS